MKQLGKPYALLSYFLSLFGGFFLGLAVAAFTEAGKGQMLAGGAIVFFYGIVGSIIALILAFVLAFKTNRKVIISMNFFYVLAIAATFFYLKYNKQQRDIEREKKQQPIEKQNTPTQVTTDVDTAMLLSIEKPFATQLNQTGLGMFSPNLNDTKTLYFYGDINFEKSILEHAPIDSITFKPAEYGGVEIATAPPWLMPEHLKLDYNILYFKVQTMSQDFLEVTVNRTSEQTSYVDRRAGQLLYWPQFFMSVHSVEFLNSENQSIYARPFDNSGELSVVSYSFMQPLKIKQEWMFVSLITDTYEEVAQGWIRWTRNGELLITYSLLS